MLYEVITSFPAGRKSISTHRTDASVWPARLPDSLQLDRPAPQLDDLARDEDPAFGVDAQVLV